MQSFRKLYGQVNVSFKPDKQKHKLLVFQAAYERYFQDYLRLTLHRCLSVNIKISLRVRENQ